MGKSEKNVAQAPGLMPLVMEERKKKSSGGKVRSEGNERDGAEDFKDTTGEAAVNASHAPPGE